MRGGDYWSFWDADFLIVVDECYHEVLGETVVDLLPEYPHLMIMRSFSKAFGLAGLRVGYGMASTSICDYLVRVAQSYSVNRIAQAAALAAIEDVESARARIATVCAEREWLAKELGGLGYRVAASGDQFFCWSRRVLGDGHRPSWLRNCENPRYLWRILADIKGLDESWFRITLGQPEENRALLEVLSRLLGVDSSRDSDGVLVSARRGLLEFLGCGFSGSCG